MAISTTQVIFSPFIEYCIEIDRVAYIKKYQRLKNTRTCIYKGKNASIYIKINLINQYLHAWNSNIRFIRLKNTHLTIIIIPSKRGLCARDLIAVKTHNVTNIFHTLHRIFIVRIVQCWRRSRIVENNTT